MSVDATRQSLCQSVGLIALLAMSVLTPLLLGGGGGAASDAVGASERTVDCPCKTVPLQRESQQSATRNDVVILIDALRPDVLNNASLLPRFHNFVSSGRVWQRRLDASAPTVTLPKIRTIVTGREGSFMDVLWNFFAERLAAFPSHALEAVDLSCSSLQASSSLLHLLSCFDNDLATARRRIAFYGDNTWLKLYPNSSNVFVRSEGVASFDVSDSVAVDRNVSRRVEEELRLWALPPVSSSKSDTVDLLLLHYLGYDHIGHTEDPRTSLRAQEKLTEMDILIEQLVESVCWGGSDESAVYVISDHGMALKGGHGGASTLERSTVFARIGCRQRSELSMELERDEVTFQSRQVDASAMLALGLGLIDSRRQDVRTLVLPNSLGLAPPSFVSTLLDDEAEAEAVTKCALLHSLTGATFGAGTVCSKVSGTGMRGLLDQFSVHFKPAQERLYAAASGSLSSQGQKWWKSAVCVACLATSLGAVTIRLHGPPTLPDAALVLHLGTIVTQGAVMFSSSFVEEEPFVVYGLFSLCLVVVIASTTGTNVIVSRQQLSTLLIGAVCMRACALSIFPQGVKWKDLVDERPQPADGELVWYALLDWKWRFALPLNSLTQFVGTQLSEHRSLARLMLASDYPLGLVASSSVILFAARRQGCSLVPAVILAVVACTLPLSWPFVLCFCTVVTGTLCVVVSLHQSRWLLVLLPLLVEVCHFSLGRSIHLSDVLFAHLLPSFVAADDTLLHWVGGPLVFLWHHCGRAAALAVIAWTLPRRSLSQVVLSCLLRQVALTSFCGLMAIWMEGHIFYWSVFLNKALFCLLDCVFYGLVGLVAWFR